MRRNSRTERGMVSILVTMIMMVVITLIIIGISQVTRSNRREQLDQQLSTQAYYAAESGLNQAVKFFAANPTAKINTMSTPSSCTQFITGASPSGLQQVLGVGNVLDSGTNVSYTCLMVNSTPPTLQKAPLTQDANTVWHVQDSTGAAFTQLRFQWTPNGESLFTGPTNTCPVGNSSTPFPSYANWKCAFGILRVDLVSTAGSVSGATLENPAKTLYLVPTFTASGVPVGTVQNISAASQAAQVVYVQCTATLCDIRLNPATWTSSSDYYARLSVVYQDSDSATLSGANASGAAKFSGGQAVIDVTGKAQDQLRRVQARIPLNVSTAPVPYYALQSTDDLCKQLSVASGLNTLDSCPL